MTHRVLLSLLVTVAAAAAGELPRQIGERYLLPNGWSLTPAGRQVELGGMPLKLTPVPGTRYMLAMSNGYTQHFIAIIDTETEKVVQQLPLAEGWMGVTASADGKKVYASGGSRDCIEVYDFANGALVSAGQIALGKLTFPAGLALNKAGDRLYITANLSHELLVVDLATRQVAATIPVGVKPYTCVVTADEKTAYVSNWGEISVTVVDLAARRVRANIAVQEKPNDLLLTPDEKRLFVANGNRNTVSVIDTRSSRVIETIDAAIVPRSPLGSTPNALALSANARTLFIANADNNCLAVFDVSDARRNISRGFIPTGWYPTAVSLTSNAKLVVANGKGSVSKPNAANWQGSELLGRKSLGDAKNPAYIGRLLEGSVSFVPMPDEAALARYSQQVHQNSPHANTKVAVKAPIALGRRSPIKHVIYIIKENRTYDCVFGDMKEGNGDADYAIFPERATPNHHALAREFVLFDNFYHDAEVSADGHHWVTSAYATDYVEKFWPSMYAGRGQKQRPSLHDDPVAFSVGGFIWDLCKRAGISYRSYGEGARVHGAPKGQTRAAMPSLVGHHHLTYLGADAISSMSDSQRFDLWLEDFRQFEKKGEMPRFQVLSLPGDHTLGTRPGGQTPRAMLAENDLALGHIVEAVSHSRFWSSTAIFVTEDDAQGGPDHVDCHRTVALVVSPYTRRHAVDSTMYSTSSMLRTMEQILGLPPMTQYDAAATPMWAAFRAEPNATFYDARPNQIPLDEKNQKTAWGAQRSLEFTLEEADTAPDEEFGEIIWKSVKGADSPLPPRRVAAFVRAKKDADGDRD